MNQGRIRARVIKREQGDDVSDDRYEFQAEISNDLLDSYYTTMHITTLRNFREDAKQGVAFLEGHMPTRMNYGRTFNARLNKAEDRQRVLADIYTIRDINFGGHMSFPSTNDFIRAVETDLVSDVSVGFYGGIWRCDLCGMDVFDWSDWENMCRHWPGETYEEDDVKVVATATIEDARLSEVSVVYDGATPEAQITKKARSMFERGLIDTPIVYRLNTLYNLRMAPDKWDASTIGDKRSLISHKSKGGASPMDLLEIIKSASIEGIPTDDAASAVRWLIDKHGTLGTELETAQSRTTELETENEELKNNASTELESARKLNVDMGKQVDVVRSENTQLKEQIGVLETARDLDNDVAARNDELKTQNDELTEQVETLTTENRELTDKVAESEEMAKLGQQTRDELVESTLKSGVTAYGDDFDKEEQKTVLEAMDLKTIRLTKKSWDDLAEERFPGGRQSKDNGGEPPDPNPKRSVEPDEIYGIPSLRR